MGLVSTVRDLLTLSPPLAEHRRDVVLATPFDGFPPLDVQLANLRHYPNAGPWRTVSIREALGVPAIFGAVNLISNTVASMSMKAYRGEVELRPDDRPRLIVRPDPFTIPREFYRSTTYNIASRGEADWWIAARDGDGLPLSVINLPPHEVAIEENLRDPRYPIVTWNRNTGKPMTIRNDDFRQLVYSREPGALRGVGPLQMCGAAISVAVESQDWAANFFADGGVPSIWIKTNLDLSGDDGPLDEDGAPTGRAEVERFRDQWMEKSHNTPRITGDAVEDIREFNTNPQGAQMLTARGFQNAEVATMFNIDATLLNAATMGSSITYQNVGSEFDKFLRMCLRPNYLEAIEQTMSDLLPRAVVSRFNTDSLTLADTKTRYDTYGVGIDKGIISADEARSFEGLAAGDVENAAVPPAVPQAIPGPSEFRSAPVEMRCQNMIPKRRAGVMRISPCGKLLSTDGKDPGWCPRCRQATTAA
jgi:HK97 family phage portal protein